MTSQTRISEITEGKPKKRTTEMKQEHMERLANINAPQEYKEKYNPILVKHFNAISIDKNNLGRAKDFFHKIDIKDNEPVYRNQFKIPDAQRPVLEESLAEWLKLGVVQKSDSLYNSPVFYVP